MPGMPIVTSHRHFSQELFAPDIFVGDEINSMALSSAAGRGAVFTKPEVVEFMLDLAGYTANRKLWRMRLLEPSFGAGDFLVAAVKRLLISWRRDNQPTDVLKDAVHGVELHRTTFETARLSLLVALDDIGISRTEAGRLVDGWLVCGDYLLQQDETAFDFVVGNPPYVRQELIPERLLAEYRQRYVTMYDRADLYIPFIERSLLHLRPGGTLSFICSDRWMKNRYGGPLRQMVADGYRLKYYVDMVGTAAFQSDVIAYPAITVITREQACTTRLAHQPEVSASSLTRLCRQMTGPASGMNGTVTEVTAVVGDGAPWLLEADALPSLGLVRRLEALLPTLEEAGCKVGIGVATGADKVFIGPMTELDVEDDRKLPLVTTRDIQDGSVRWKGLAVVNPFHEDGRLADFDEYPRFAAFMKKHEMQIKARHCAKKNADGWYRTIDRITPSLAQKPKLLIPDIKGAAHIVHEPGNLYPHHNLYYITSDEWPLEALGWVLMAGIAGLFVRAYSTKMHGGCLRFQAQYLRRIRLPHWRDISARDQKALIKAASDGDAGVGVPALQRIYGLTNDDMLHLNPLEKSCP